MNRPLLSLIAMALAASSALAQTPQFTHRASIALNTVFDGDVLGNDAADVAFDGKHIFIGGYVTATPENAPYSVGVARITIDNFSDFSHTITENVVQIDGAAGASRTTRLTLDPLRNALIVGYAMGSDIQRLAGFRRYTLINGAPIQDLAFGGDGVTTPAEFRNGSGRVDAFDYDAANDRLGGVGIFNGVLYQVNPVTGLHIQGTFFNPTTPTGWRDISFDPDGNIYARWQGDVIFRPRNADLSVGAVTVLVDLDLADDGVNNTIEYVAGVPGSFDPFLVYNNRSTTASNARRASVATLTGSMITTLSGLEPIVNGQGAPTEFTARDFNYTVGQGQDGKYYLFVLALNQDRLSIYEIGEPAKTVSGTVTLPEYVDPTGVEIEVLLRTPGTTTTVESKTVTLDANGDFSFTTSQAGTFDVAFDGSKWLRKVVAGVTITGSTDVDVVLNPGDINGDNEVNLDDYFDLADSFRLSEGEQGFNPNADLNGDLSVNLDDYFILADNFRLLGDE